MKDFLQLENKERLFIFEQIRSKTGMNLQAIEKDWWVTQSLRLIFMLDCAPHLVFKGGTSLSKAWDLIERFSEDIDLALDRKYLGFDKEMTGSQVSKLRKTSFKYISTIFFNQLIEKFSEEGLENLKIQIAEVKDADKDPLIIEIYYPEVTGFSEYLKPRVLIEIGSRSLRDPFTLRTFSSLVGEHFAGRTFADEKITIPVVNPERTFLEKIFLLHEEFQKPADKIRVDRLSRHFYDIERLMDTTYAKIAMTDNELYWNIVDHRRTLTPVRGIDYDNHTPEKIRLIPPEHIQDKWQKDYEIMQENMIYGESLPFDKLLMRIAEVQHKINAIIR